jgi:hypothetical protein
MNLRGPLRGKGEVGRVSGFSLPPTRVKSGQAFAPQNQKGDFQISKRGLTGGQVENGGKGGAGNKKGITKGFMSMCLQYVYYANKRLCLGYK